METNPHAPKHPKQEFQVERLAFFSDAVFAIAITLLVIEFKVPHVTKESTYADIWHEVVHMKYQLLALILSFFIISTYWVRHHFLFKHLHNYNNKVVKINMLALLPVIFFPFTTAFLYESLINIEVLPIPFRLFLINNIAASAGTYALYWVAMKKHKEFSYPMELAEEKDFKLKLILTIVSFSLVFVLSFISMEVGLYGLFPLAAYMLLNKFSKKKK
jgi:uncharacterized membrane protein